jgi:hyperosmotically inducible periplasmic protein
MILRKQVVVLPIAIILFAVVGAGQQHNMSFSQITAEIQDRLYHAHIFQHGNVQVSFSNGVATLTGGVDSVGVKMDAEKAARKVDDVNKVVDQVTINRDDTAPEGILRQARRSILLYPFYTIFDHIVLQCQPDGDLIVSGQVTQPYKKLDIGNFLAHIDGVTQLTNNLQVLPVSQFDDEIRIAVARAIYDDPYFINYRNQPIPPIHIIVDNGNVTLYGVVNSPVDKAKAGEDARLATTYFGFKNDLRVEHE